MTRQITQLSAATELEAVNVMLSAIGEAPLAAGTDLATVTDADVQAAVSILRDATRNVQTKGWRFNREFGYELAPDGTLDWPTRDGNTTTLNVFTPPANMARCDVTAGQALDLIIRRARKYGEPTQPLVFYDRAKNRDGIENEFLYIDPVWLFDFEDLPQEARSYITLLAARQFAQRILGSAERAGFTQQDENRAALLMIELHGSDDKYNILDNADVADALGGRPYGSGMVYDIRKTSGLA
jgi:hypothetical protein